MKATTRRAAELVTVIALLALGVISVPFDGHAHRASPLKTYPGAAESRAALTDSMWVPTQRMVIATEVVEAPSAEVPDAVVRNPPRSPSSGNEVPSTSPPVEPPPPPAEPVIDHTPRIRHNENYKPGCGSTAFMYSQELTQGSTAVITVTYKYEVSSYETANGFGVRVYICEDQS